jgi:hypothetical protein
VAKQTKMGRRGGGEVKLLYIISERGRRESDQLFRCHVEFKYKHTFAKFHHVVYFQPAEGNIHIVIYKT